MFLAAAVVLAAASACASSSSPSPQDLADQTTKSVYASDYDGTIAHFDDDLKRQVTRGSVGSLSDRMHALGAYQSLAQTSTDPDHGRYVYDATFDHGHLRVELRLDPDGKIGAYRVADAAS